MQSGKTGQRASAAGPDALPDAHERLGVALRCGGVVLWELDPRTGALRLSDSFGDVLGYGPDDFPSFSSDLLRLVHPGDFENCRLLFEWFRSGSDTAFTAEFRLRSRSGRYVWLRFIGRVLSDTNGRYRAVGAMSDVSAEKELARGLAQENQALERLVEERERALTREKELNEMQRQFISMASHEFRTPLAIISSAAQWVARRPARLSASDIVAHMETVRGAVKRMTTMMESTLTAAKMDAGKLHIKTADCQLRTLVEDICRQQRQIAIAHRITVDLGDLPARIRGDHAALELVFANLLSNAVKYSPDAPDITVRGGHDGDHAVVSVQDRGVGMGAEDLPNLFNRFFRAKSATGIAGTGIGLNLVKRLVDEHGGEIAVDSAIGQGSTFTVRLPVHGHGQADDDVGQAA